MRYILRFFVPAFLARLLTATLFLTPLFYAGSDTGLEFWDNLFLNFCTTSVMIVWAWHFLFRRGEETFYRNLGFGPATLVLFSIPFAILPSLLWMFIRILG